MLSFASPKLAPRLSVFVRSLLPIPLVLALTLLLRCGGPGPALSEGGENIESSGPLTTLRVHYPAGSHHLSIRGDSGGLNWSADAALDDAGGDIWTYTTRAAAGALHWKPLLDGSWSIGPNYAANAGDTVDVYPWFQSQSGSVVRFDNWWSNDLQNSRPIWVYTPPSYAEQTGEQYPVIYMHDGQNLFDPNYAFGGTTWQVAQSMDQGALDGSIREAIVVGIGNTDNRIWEYTPNDSLTGYTGGGAATYLSFMTDELMPQINQGYRTSTDRLDTAIVGSSLGGIVSACAGLWRPDVFGLVGVMSPSTWWHDDWIIGAVQGTASAPVKPARVYVDSGDSGDDGDGDPGATEDDATLTTQLFQAYQGVGYIDAEHVIGQGDTHTESAWARRFPGGMQFLLGGRANQ